MFRQDNTCPVLLDSYIKIVFNYRAITFYGQTFQTVYLTHLMLKGWSPFARRY